MKLIARLTILLLVFAYWSNGFIDSTVNEALNQDPVLEQLRRSTVTGTWIEAVWAEWVLSLPPSGRCRRRKRRRRLRKRRRLSRMRFRRWRLLRQRWRALMEDELPGESATGCCYHPRSESESRSATSVPVANQQASSAVVADDTVPQPPQPARRGPGRPRTIPTNHRCCPNEACTSYGITSASLSAGLGSHPQHNIVGNGVYMTAHGEKRQMYLCNVCDKPFSETAGTPFFALKTPLKTVCIALNELAEKHPHYRRKD